MTQTATENRKRDLRRVITPPFRMSFPHLLVPREDEKGKKTYTVSMLFPPKTQLQVFRTALREAMVAKFGPEEKRWDAIKHTPREVIRDFDAYNRASKKPLAGDWAGWTMIRANCSDQFPPNVVGPVKSQDGVFPRITEPREIYGGRWASAAIQAYYFSAGGMNTGVTFGLQSVQLLRHDQVLGIGRVRPEDDFQDAPEEWQPDAFERGDAREVSEAADASPW